MANIDTLLQNIRISAYGEDIRSAVYEALKAINEENESIRSEMDQKIAEISELAEEIRSIRDEILTSED